MGEYYVCHLPTGPNGTNGSEFNTMLSQADIANGIDNGSGSNINVGYKPNGFTKLESSPYSFGRFGFMYGIIIYNVTGNGTYWSGNTVSASNAFYLRYVSSELHPSLSHPQEHFPDLTVVNFTKITMRERSLKSIIVPLHIRVARMDADK